MSAPPPPPPPRGGLSLYDNLLDPNETPSSATISSAPVLYTNPGSSAAATIKKPFQPALNVQQIRRPQVKQPTKPKIPLSSKAALKPPVAAAAAATSSPTPLPTSSSTGPLSAPQKNSLAEWTATEEDEWRYGYGEKRQRGGRKNKKRKQQAEAETDWDDIYDPAKPTNVGEYLRSDEKLDEIRDWKDLLYRHRRNDVHSDLSDDDEDSDSRPMPSKMFAPPASYTFAPPPQSPPAPPAPPAAPLPDDNTGDDAYARRLALSQAQPQAQPHAPPAPPAAPPTVSAASSQTPYSATISAAPVRYNTGQVNNNAEHDDDAYSPPPSLGSGAAAAADDEKEGEEELADTAPRTKRPGQAGFAQRIMSKYGWTKGSGLGADESGITNALRVKVDKRRRKADGGGWVAPSGKGKIIGGKRGNEEASRFGTMSEVIVLQNMLENMADLQHEIAEGLGQEIGEECGEKYGRVERLYIDQDTRQVYIKFTDQVSALRAVNELDGRVFNGNTIVPRFYDTERFEQGIYG